MTMLLRNKLPALSMGLVLLIGACGPGGPPNEPIGTPPPPPARTADGLLANPQLQDIVDLQVARDGEAITAFLDHPDAVVRARAAFALASVQYPEASSALMGLLRDPDPSVRRDAAFALGQLEPGIQGAGLLGALGEETDPEARLRILEAIGKVGDERILERLLALELGTEEAAAQSLAVSRMGVRGVVLPSGIQHLLAGMKDPDARVRENSGYYFGRSNAPGPWAPRVGELRAVLDSLPPSDPLAMHLLLGLAQVGDPQDTPRILWWMGASPDWRVRSNAARAAAGRTADPRVRAALIDALDDPTTHVAYQAGNALAGASQLPPGERDALREWVESHPGEWLRAGAILALLGRMGEGEFILKWLSGWEQEQVLPRTRGLGALAFVPGQRSMETLQEAAKEDNSRIRGTALGALARRWRVEREDTTTHAAYFQAFEDGLRAGDPASSYVAAPALADSAFLPLGSVDLLLDVYAGLSPEENLEGMRVILGALAETGVPEAEAFLTEVSREGPLALREGADQALSRLRGEEPERGNRIRPAEREIDWAALARLGSSVRLILDTEKGRVTLVLDSESAPLTVQTITGFAQEGKYDGVPFHRVVPNFVVQGGDFSRHDGYGGPGFDIRSEFTETPYLRGVIGMASSGKDTEGSQFFITHSMQPHLDGGYTVFGWVEEGMDVVDMLYEEDLILTATVEVGME
jgi:cyclophilin family peptidyl-prolyl cis-trans isomerase/HEAT repeat protein